MTIWMKRAAAAAMAIGLTGAAACGDSESPTAPTATLSAEARAALERSLQDEYRAETTYAGVIEDLGTLLPFVNVLTAEQRHSAAIAQLFTRRGLSAPASEWSLAEVQHFTSAPAACAAAADAERANVALYDGLLRLALPGDVRQVFENVRAASLTNHLPAFERCS
jgi:hypothetical protein